MQVYGGHGYIRDHGMEQFVRDARIAMIYEGTNGVQALDLVGRKLAPHNGRYAARVLPSGAANSSRQHAADEQLRRHGASHWRRRSARCNWPPRTSPQTGHGATRRKPAPRRPNTCGCSGWSRSASCGRGWQRSSRREAAGGERRCRSSTRRNSSTARFYMERILPQVGAPAGRDQIRQGGDDGDRRSGVLTRYFAPATSVPVRVPARPLSARICLPTSVASSA